MTADASECNGGGGAKEEVMEGDLALSLGSGGDRKRLDSAGEPLGGRISDGSSEGKDDRRPDHRDLESDPLGGAQGADVAEDPAVTFVVGGEKGVRREVNAASEEARVETTNGGGAAGVANEGSGEQILENGRGHREETAAVVGTDAVTAENCVVGVETEMPVSGETLEVRGLGDVEVVGMKASSDTQGEKNEFCSEDGKELKRQNGHCNQLHQSDGDDSSLWHSDKGDASEAETDVGREPLSRKNSREQLEFGTAAEDLKGVNEVTSIEVDDGKSSHVAEDERSGIHKQVERELEGRPVDMVSIAADEGSLEACHGRQSESTHNESDAEPEINQQGGSESMEHQEGLVPVVGDEGCFKVHYIRESEPFHDAPDEKSKINQQVESESEHQVNLVPVVGDEECLELDHTMDGTISSRDTADLKSEIDQLVEPGSEEQRQGCEIVADEAEHQDELKSSDDIDVNNAVTELNHQAVLEQRKGQLNETITTLTGDQIERVATVEDDVNLSVDIAVTEFDHQVESVLEGEGQLTETVMPDADDQLEEPKLEPSTEPVSESETVVPDADGQLEQMQEPSTEPVSESDQVPPEQVVLHSEEKECLNFVRQVNALQEIETVVESEMQQSHAILVDNPSSIAEDAPIAEPEEKLKLENNLVNMATSESACTDQAEVILGDMAHNVSSEKFNTGGKNVPDTNLQGHLAPNENKEMRPTSNCVTVVKDVKTDPGNSDVVHDSDAGVDGEVAMVIDVNQVAKDISDRNYGKGSTKIEDSSGAYAEPSNVDIDSSADASGKDGNEVESRYPESEHNYSQSSISNVTQYYHGNQFIKFGEIVANLDEAHNPKRGPFFIIRIPRFTGDELWAKIQQAQDEVDEKTKSRDLINKEVQMQKAICLRVSGELAAAGFTELATREAFEAKRAELNYVASMVTMLSTARSLEEIDTKIKEMEFNHQHVTVPLKEEKKYIQELKQLKRQREDISSFMASKNEIDKALKDEDSIDQKLKDLKKEMDSLRADLAQAEAKAIIARKKYDDEEKVLQNLRKQYDAANEIRQNAFSHLQHLKKESFEKSRYFHKYKNDQMTAKSYASSGDITSLWLHCSSQVEEVMNMWNNDDEFRKQYVDCNKNSVLRRLKTLDARSLGPDQKPTVSSDMNKISPPEAPLATTVVSAKVSPPEAPLALEEKQEEALKPKEIPPATQAVQKSQPAKPRKSSVATSKPTRDPSPSLVPITELIKNTEKEKSMTKEEEELARKADELARKEEELRKEMEAAELKERLKLEQRVKAKEAEERKKKQAERVHARAEYRAQREAELKEKKRAKKEKKKGPTVSDTTLIDDKEVDLLTTENNSTFQEQQPEAQVAASSKRNSRSAVAAKQFNRVQPVPLPLRNRGRRKIGTWMWAILTAMLVIVLFVAGNYISTSTFSLSGFRF